MDENFRDVAFWPFNNGIGIGLNHRHESISTEIRRNRRNSKALQAEINANRIGKLKGVVNALQPWRQARMAAVPQRPSGPPLGSQQGSRSPGITVSCIPGGGLSPLLGEKGRAWRSRLQFSWDLLALGLGLVWDSTVLLFV